MHIHDSEPAKRKKTYRYVFFDIMLGSTVCVVRLRDGQASGMEASASLRDLLALLLDRLESPLELPTASLTSLLVFPSFFLGYSFSQLRPPRTQEMEL